MKILIAIANLSSKGGAQRVVLELAKYFSKENDIKILTANYEQEKTYFEFKNFKVTDFRIRINNFVLRQILMLIKFSFMKLEDFDVIIVHDFPTTALALRNRNVVWYCHTPFRFFYDLKGYYLRKFNPLIRFLMRFYISFMVSLDKKIVKKIPVIIANSKNVQNRIKRFYKRDAKVIHPGVSITQLEPHFEKKLLTVSRLYPEKRIMPIVKSMKELPNYKLYVVGEGPQREKIEGYIKKENLTNVKLVGNISNKELDRLYQKCFAVIYIPKNEDFGLIPLEANSFGKMVIGANEGGLKETIIDGETGILLDNPTPKKIANAVRKIEKIKPKNKVEECKENAKRFNWDIFNKKIGGIIKDEKR